MPPTRWVPGAVIAAELADHQWHYGRLLKFPWAAFYDLRTTRVVTEAARVIDHPVLFTIAAQKDLATQWVTIAVVKLDGTLRPPAAQYLHHPDDDPDDWSIIDAQDNIRPASASECAGLEPAMVYEPEHIAQRLLDPDAPNRW